MKIRFNHEFNHTHFHMKGFASGLALREKATRKWPIPSLHSHCDFIFQGRLHNREGKCLELEDGGNKVATKECNTSAKQEWIFSQNSS